jgi:adenylate cyclase
LVAAGAVGAITVSLPSVDAVQGIEERFALRWLFLLRGEIEPPKHVVLVAINGRSAREIYLPEDPLRFHRCRDLSIGVAKAGQSALPALPARWPRCLHALLIDKLTAAGARVIVFDVLFRERRPLPIADVSRDILQDEDRLLAEAARKSGRVLIAQKLEIGADKLLRPAPLSGVIEEAVLGAAPFPLPVTGIDRYDRFEVFFEEGWPTITLPALAVQAYALPVYDRFRNALAGIDTKFDAPPSAEDIRKTGKLQATALMFRTAISKHPALASGLGASLSTTRDTDLALLQSTLGIYTGPSLRYANFYGPPGRVSMRDYSSALRSSEPEIAAWAADKVVVIGFQDDEVTEQVEHFATPLTPPGHVGHSGAEILATSIANLLDDSDVRLAPLSLQIGAPIFLVLAVCLAAFGLGTVPALGVILLAVSAYVGMAFIAFAQARIWVPLAIPLATVLTLGVGSGVLFRYYEARRQRDRIRAMFIKFVPRDFVEAFERSAESALSTRKSLECVCVATDAAQFTTLAETMMPDELAQFLNRYFERLFGPIARSEGFVSDIVGDAMLGLWPVRGIATRRAACLALLEMQEASVDFSRTMAKGGMRTRFGVDLGLVSLGTLGGHEHYEYRAIGDTVNSASRLQELNKKLGTHMMVAMPLVEGLDEFLVRHLGTFQLRGKRRSVSVGELLGLRSTATESEKRLCAHFTLISHALRNSQVERAHSLLEQAKADFPADPATRFLLEALARPGAISGGALLAG